MEQNCPFDTVAYHCQQCAEMYLKALLIYWNVDFPRTHDLVVLFNLLLEKGSLNLRVQEIQPLNRYSIEARYPGDWEPIEEREAHAALDMARAARCAIRGLLDPVLSGKKNK